MQQQQQMHSYIRPGADVVFRMPSGLLKIVKIIPNTTISIPKIGSFSANLLLGRPYHFTFEVLDQLADSTAGAGATGSASAGKESNLRIVSSEELNLESVIGKSAASDDQTPDDEEASTTTTTEIQNQNGARNNRLTVDDPLRQALTMEEIEELKRADDGSGREVIKQILASHTGIKEKTAFALAKYTLRKSKKYMKRFTVLPLDVGMLLEFMLEKDPLKILELREEMMGLIMSWCNVHHSGAVASSDHEGPKIGGGRWLVVDDTGGLVVAAMAERMGLLYEDIDEGNDTGESHLNATSKPKSESTQASTEQNEANTPKGAKARKHDSGLQSANANTITVLHSNPQPNLSFLKYFSFTAEDPSTCQSHPLYRHLKTVNWLQLIDPTADPLYQEPEKQSEASLSEMKSGKRGNYYRKRNRWERVKSVVDETLAGGFDGLVIASTMEPVGAMKHCVPLIRGGGQIVVYSPSIEPLTSLMDLYSRDRRGAYVRAVQAATDRGVPVDLDEEIDFPLNPTLVLNTMLQTARAREWQVLPGRTHPLMTSRGGSEGYLFTATRVLPKEGVRVEARGKFNKKRKLEKLAVDDDIDDGADAMKRSKG